MGKLKQLFINTFSVQRTFWLAFKSTIFDTLAVVVSVIITGLMTLLTYNNPEWIGFIAYLFAIILVLIGFLISRKWPASYLSSAVGVLISSFLSVVASIDALKLMSGAILRISYWEVPLSKIPSFLLTNSTVMGMEKTIVIIVISIFGILLAHKWYYYHRAMLKNGEQKKNK